MENTNMSQENEKQITQEQYSKMAKILERYTQNKKPESIQFAQTENILKYIENSNINTDPFKYMTYGEMATCIMEANGYQAVVLEQPRRSPSVDNRNVIFRSLQGYIITGKDIAAEWKNLKQYKHIAQADPNSNQMNQSAWIQIGNKQIGCPSFQNMIPDKETFFEFFSLYKQYVVLFPGFRKYRRCYNIATLAYRQMAADYINCRMQKYELNHYETPDRRLTEKLQNLFFIANNDTLPNQEKIKEDPKKWFELQHKQFNSLKKILMESGNSSQKCLDILGVITDYNINETVNLLLLIGRIFLGYDFLKEVNQPATERPRQVTIIKCNNPGYVAQFLHKLINDGLAYFKDLDISGPENPPRFGITCFDEYVIRDFKGAFQEIPFRNEVTRYGDKNGSSPYQNSSPYKNLAPYRYMNRLSQLNQQRVQCFNLFNQLNLMDQQTDQKMDQGIYGQVDQVNQDIAPLNQRSIQLNLQVSQLNQQIDQLKQQMNQYMNQYMNQHINQHMIPQFMIDCYLGTLANIAVEPQFNGRREIDFVSHLISGDPVTFDDGWSKTSNYRSNVQYVFTSHEKSLIRQLYIEEKKIKFLELSGNMENMSSSENRGFLSGHDSFYLLMLAVFYTIDRLWLNRLDSRSISAESAAAEPEAGWIDKETIMYMFILRYCEDKTDQKIEELQEIDSEELAILQSDSVAPKTKLLKELGISSLSYTTKPDLFYIFDLWCNVSHYQCQYQDEDQFMQDFKCATKAAKYNKGYANAFYARKYVTRQYNQDTETQKKKSQQERILYGIELKDDVVQKLMQKKREIKADIVSDEERRKTFLREMGILQQNFMQDLSITNWQTSNRMLVKNLNLHPIVSYNA